MMPEGLHSRAPEGLQGLLSIFGLSAVYPKGIGPHGHAVTLGLSLVVHCVGALVVAFVGGLSENTASTETVVKVRLATPAPVVEPEVQAPQPTPVPLREKPPEVPATRKARAREREASTVRPETTEIRGGLSESTQEPDPTSLAPAVPLGNSSELAVDPSQAQSTAPGAVASGSQPGQVDYAARAVQEGFADAAADCAGALPQLDLTSDAINAGIKRGRLVFETIIDEKGVVRDARLVKGTGFEIDRVALEALKNVVCRPAKAGGQSVVVRKELAFEILD